MNELPVAPPPQVPWRRWLVVALVLELACFTWLRNAAGPYLSPLLFLASSLLVCYAAARALAGQAFAAPAPSLRGAPWPAVGLLLLVLVSLGPYIANALNATPIAAEYSDIIPVLQVYVQRFQQGEVVYRGIDNFGYHLSPGYFPATWLPFLVPDALNVDYRWMPVWLLSLGLATYAWFAGRAAVLSSAAGTLTLLWPVLTFMFVLFFHTDVLTRTVEFLVVGYYFIFIASIFSTSIGWRSAGLVLCLLSRFSLVLWVPFYLLLVWRTEGRGRALRLAGLVALGILGLFVVPFLSQNWQAMNDTAAAYTASALGEWTHNLNAEGKPTQLFNGVGLCLYFYSLPWGTVLDRLQLARAVHLVASLGTALGCVGWYLWRGQRSTLDYRYLAVITLKLYLVVFYGFIQVPYTYLLMLPLLVSAWLLACVRGPEPAGGAPAFPS